MSGGQNSSMGQAGKFVQLYQFLSAKSVVTLLAALMLCVLTPQAASAKKKTGPVPRQIDIPEVPDDDIFGFTSPTGLGDAGDLGFANENDGRLRKRDGRYSALDAKYELGYTISEAWWIAGSGFAGRHRSENVTDLADVSTVAFEGLSFELAHRLIKRSASNPFAVTLSVEPRWGRIDGTTGLRSDFYNAAFKVFTDAVVVPDRIFWAANLAWAPQRAQDINDRNIWLKTSSSLASTALTFQLSPQLFVGAEARHLASFDRGRLDDRVGYAVYVGPTLLWKITDKIVFNATWQPQVAGHSIANPDLRYDLDNYERAQFRAKLSIALN
jgi:hypothetical protein